jgi:RHS repeat-associated protein
VSSYDNYADYQSGSATQTVTYTYDVFNRWIGETVTAGGTTTQNRYVYDGNQIVLQFQKAGTGDLAATDLSHRYLWGPAVDQLLADEQVTNGLNQAGNVVWTLTDNEGTVRDLATYDAQTGVTTVANHRVYDSFGNLTSQTNAAVDCIFGFTGLPYDKASGLDMSQTRPYDSLTGRWLGQDSDGLNGGDTNLYRYCGNSPTNETDPTGTQAEVALPIAGAGAAATLPEIAAAIAAAAPVAIPGAIIAIGAGGAYLGYQGSQATGGLGAGRATAAICGWYYGAAMVSAQTIHAWEQDLQNLNDRIDDLQRKIDSIENSSRGQRHGPDGTPGLPQYDTKKSQELLDQLIKEAAELAAKIQQAKGEQGGSGKNCPKK